MKKYMPLILIFLFLSIQNFASSGIKEMNFDKESLKINLKEVLRSIEIIDQDGSMEIALLDPKFHELMGCWIYTINCSCTSFQAQWCDEGFHPPLIDWIMMLCCQACGDQCLYV